MSVSPLHPLVARCFETKGIDSSSLSLSGHIARCPSSGAAYYIKTSRNIGQVLGEAAGLLAMARTAPPGLVPGLIGVVVADDGRQVGMVSEYAELGSRGGKEFQRELGTAIAKMHSVPLDECESESSSAECDVEESGSGDNDVIGIATRYTGQFGFDIPTHCGVTQQDNTKESSWEVFFRDRRLGDLVTRLGDPAVTRLWESMKTRAVPMLLHSFHPRPQPVILHGDLWSGNVGARKSTGGAVVYDPAVYYGHGEADLGITSMFGGFSEEFYEAYHAVHPRSSPYYAQRQQLYELYHHLNHALMFGAGYRRGAMGIMAGLVSWAEGVDDGDGGDEGDTTVRGVALQDE